MRKESYKLKKEQIQEIITNFYKDLYTNPIMGPMMKMCNEVLQIAVTPRSGTEAIITLVPKDDSDPTEIGNDRPISLLNVDHKIPAMIMANRIRRFLNDSIDSDQNGFLPKRPFS